jgi:glycosyltransferase involved in cell wall biosynthesis
MEHFVDKCRYPNYELILADDGSSRRKQERMKRIRFDRYLLSEENRGVGANANRAIRAAKGEYILYLEDDWICLEDTDCVQQAIEILDANPDVGYVRFIPSVLPLFESRTGPRGQRLRIYARDQDDHPRALYVYNSGPHLKRSSFHPDVGWYVEGQHAGITEEEFCRLFLEQERWKVCGVEGWDLFRHNLLGYPSTRPDRWRQNLRLRAEGNPIVSSGFRIYDRLPKVVRGFISRQPVR